MLTSCSGGYDDKLAHHSALVEMKPNRENVRPHPGPLPQERVNRLPPSREAQARRGWPHSGTNCPIATRATMAWSVPRDVAIVSLSTGVRGEPARTTIPRIGPIPELSNSSSPPAKPEVYQNSSWQPLFIV